jgi:hypothetical protein
MTPLKPTLKLKIKRCALARESKITRQMELKWARKAKQARDRQKSEALENINTTRTSLFCHRTITIRVEARIMHLINAFICGVPYERVEQKTDVRSFAICKPNKFWQDVAREAWFHCGNGTAKNRDELEKKIYAWRDAHPGHKMTVEKQGSLADIKAYGNAWLHL